jgi:hypothetical protein
MATYSAFFTIFSSLNKKQPAHPALSDEFSTKSVKKSAKTRTVKHWNRETSKYENRLLANIFTFEICSIQ